jgi:hypothetical protein
MRLTLVRPTIARLIVARLMLARLMRLAPGSLGSARRCLLIIGGGLVIGLLIGLRVASTHNQRGGK